MNDLGKGSGLKVSVIIPVYNAEKYLSQCLDSVMNQTLREIEIICIDDGSADSSPDILSSYQKRDPRFIILSQDHKYAGEARNCGKRIARGKYMIFWDADDYFDPKALEEMYNKAEEDQADICICGGYQYYEDRQFVSPSNRYIRKEEIPDVIPFNRITAEDHIISITVEAAWNKLFSSSFVRRTGLDFQNCRNANDVYFVVNSLCCADRVTLVNKKLIYYRKNKSGGLVSTVSQALINAINSWVSTAENLKVNHMFPEKSFSNKALESILDLLNNTADWESFKEGYTYLQQGNLEKLAIKKDAEDGYYFIGFHQEAARRLYENTPEEFSRWMGNYWFTSKAAESGKLRKVSEERNQLKKMTQKHNETIQKQNETIQKLNKTIKKNNDTIQKQKTEIGKLKGSVSFKIGRLITWLPRKIRKIFNRLSAQER